MNLLVFKIKPNKQNASAKITLEGDLSIKNALELQHKLQDAVLQYSVIYLSVRKVTEIDVAGIQLLYSAKKTMENAGKRLELDLELPDKLNELLIAGGFLQVLHSIGQE